MTIQQLLEMQTGPKNRVGGFQLTVKTPRKTRKQGTRLLQEALLVDTTGEIVADISLPKNVPLQRLQRINITVCWPIIGEKNNKLFVEQWYPEIISVDDLSPTFNSAWGAEDSDAMEWLAMRREEVKGKCRHGVVCAIINAGVNIHEVDKYKELINKWVDFIVTGE